jgi:hypothetical protein
MIEPYARLLELALLESSLVSDGRLDDLPPLWAERAEIVARLPEVPPADAVPTLRQEQTVVRGTQAALEATIAGLREELRGVGRGRRAAAGYGAGKRPQAVDALG